MLLQGRDEPSKVLPKSMPLTLGPRAQIADKSWTTTSTALSWILLPRRTRHRPTFERILERGPQMNAGEREKVKCALVSSDAVRRVIHYLGRKVSWRGRRFQVVGDVWSDVISSNASERAGRWVGDAFVARCNGCPVRPAGFSPSLSLSV